ncbi:MULTISPECIES: E3 binding domain-containing protein [Deinococcus]|uniref:E3 binding domain-containing protein n=1 Tax=Deinococcus rufus TaxID=2136097 RepID=A0ABV7Z9B2_9DEIO|nr:E3 binding domain-containing protein [Deinococcus sp. AB2017081]WQE96202.1 E3 binding domain-containing protein [Deinococcus sp. AB2017081]
MERIAPLAKILAEANGIDWQHLRGTGDGGMIVEQDILNYLSRIMTGEEEPPSTPVDVPPPDWNGDMNAMPDLSGVSADQLTRAGVESDLTSLMGQPAVSSPQVPATPAAALDDDLEFELDDAEPEPTPAPVAAAPAAPAPSLGGWEWSAPSPASGSPLVPAPVADVVADPVPTFSLPMPAAQEVSGVAAPEVGTPAPAAEPFPFGAGTVEAPASMPVAEPVAEPAAVPAAGLGSLLSRLYQQPAPTPEPVTPAPAPADVTPAAPAPWQPAPAMDLDAPDQDSGPALDTGTNWPAPAAPEPVAQPAWAPAWTADVTPVAAAPLPEPQAAEPEAADPMPAHVAEPVATAPAIAEPTEPESTEPEPVSAEAKPATPEPTAPVVEDAPASEPDPEPVAAAPVPVAAAPQAGQDAVWFGTYLRRDTDMAALTDLHGQLVAALGQHLPLALLVARAAQRHAGHLGLHSVALQGASGARSVDGETLRAAADASTHEYQGTPDLLVVDAGAHGLDDLHYPHTTTLSVGRLQDGRAALTLNGTVDAGRGAEFLAAVATTLGQPVLLLL